VGTASLVFGLILIGVGVYVLFIMIIPLEPGQDPDDLEGISLNHFEIWESHKILLNSHSCLSFL